MMIAALLGLLFCISILASEVAAAQEESCVVKGCCELDCCGKGSRWDTNSEYCVVDASSPGFDGEYPEEWQNGCVARACCEDACCSDEKGTRYNSSLACCVPLTIDCNDGQDESLSFEDAFELASGVFSGRVRAIQSTEQALCDLVTFELLSMWKGSNVGEDGMLTISTARTEGLCRFPFKMNESYVVFSESDTNGLCKGGYDRVTKVSKTETTNRLRNDVLRLNAIETLIVIADIPECCGETCCFSGTRWIESAGGCICDPTADGFVGERVDSGACDQICSGEDCCTSDDLPTQWDPFTGYCTADEEDLLTNPTVCVAVAEEVLESMGDYQDNSQACFDQSEAIKGFTQDAQDYYAARIDISNKANKTVVAIKKADEFVQPNERLIKAIPNIGPLLISIVENLVKVSEKINDKLILGSEGKAKMIARKDNFSKAEARIDKFQIYAEKHHEFAANVSTVLGRAINVSKDFECCGAEAINAIADFAPHEAVDLFSTIFDKCANGFGFDLPDIAISIPTCKVCDDLSDALDKIADWIDKLLKQMKKQADYFKCCDPLGKALDIVFDKFAGFGNLASCFVSGAVEGAVSATLDELIAELFGPLVDLLNSAADVFNSVINKLNAISLPLPDVDQAFPSVSFDEPCTFNVRGAKLPTSLKEVNLFEIESVAKIEVQSTGGFNPLDIGKAIASSCTNAWNSLNDKPVKCCAFATREFYPTMPEEGWPTRVSCNYKTDCASDKCRGGIGGLECTEGANGETCNENSQCDSRRCEGAFPPYRCRPKLDPGESCDEQSDCVDDCILFRCSDKSKGSLCALGSDCIDKCIFGECSDGTDGSSCILDGDCLSGRCATSLNPPNRCRPKLAIGEACIKTSDCAGRAKCTLAVCSNGENGSRCALGSDCVSGRCKTGTCNARLDNGKACASDADCKSRFCNLFTCRRKRRNGEACKANNDCESGKCKNVKSGFGKKCRS